MADNILQNSGGSTMGGNTPIPGGKKPASATANSSAGSTTARTANMFDIPEEVKIKYPDLIELILQTESMNDDERNYWFQTLPIMTNEQVQTLRNILVTEKEKLQALDQKYQEEMQKIDQKQIAEWKSFEEKQKKQVLIKAEDQHKVSDAKEEEDLLKELDNL